MRARRHLGPRRTHALHRRRNLQAARDHSGRRRQAVPPVARPRGLAHDFRGVRFPTGAVGYSRLCAGQHYARDYPPRARRGQYAPRLGRPFVDRVSSHRRAVLECVKPKGGARDHVDWEHGVLSPSVQKDILEAFVKSDLADLAGSVLFALNANAIENTPDSDTNYNLMKTIQTTFHTIGTTHTPAILEECSRDYAPDWIKVQHQFVVRGMCMDLYTDRDRNITTTPSAVRKRHYELCNGVWDSVAQALRLKDQITDGVLRMLAPSARRSLIVVSDAKLGESLGWVRSVCVGERDPHRHTCQQLSQVFDPAHASDPLSFAPLLSLLNPQNVSMRPMCLGYRIYG
ncbi:hypothetical protein AG1IA_09221 [Rhizoctonia solani AG-1 IA]|uniref:Uncharacterized protein n=1 Tax=Thanatephorus cucumeris (strain AG1-IA) TaxID=983506 RepID=L8WIW2_THACA|nr:hypothetical protein AG1IA_09221 [Rhizoctonia solani AG-1 IA]